MVARKNYTIQENGQVTLPLDFRRKYGLKKGDVVVFKETDAGLLIDIRETLALSLMDQLGDALQARGITLEELIASGQEIRQAIRDKKYAQDK